METHPIIMSAPMVRALLEGRKTQTRRIINLQPISPGEGAYFDAYDGGPQWNWWTPDNRQYLTQIINCPYGKRGDLLWVPESWGVHEGFNQLSPHLVSIAMNGDYEGCIDYAATPRNEGWTGRWRPSIHMPRLASRLTLELTEVRVERLQEINHADAMAEGVKHAIDLLPLIELRGDDFAAAHTKAADDAAREAYKHLWNSIHGPDAWDDNPWVWVLAFKTHHCNIDDLIKQKAANP